MYFMIIMKKCDIKYEKCYCVYLLKIRVSGAHTTENVVTFVLLKGTLADI